MRPSTSHDTSACSSPGTEQDAPFAPSVLDAVRSSTGSVGLQAVRMETRSSSRARRRPGRARPLGRAAARPRGCPPAGRRVPQGPAAGEVARPYAAAGLGLERTSKDERRSVSERPRPSKPRRLRRRRFETIYGRRFRRATTSRRPDPRARSRYARRMEPRRKCSRRDATTRGRPSTSCSARSGLRLRERVLQETGQEVMSKHRVPRGIEPPAAFRVEDPRGLTFMRREVASRR